MGIAKELFESGISSPGEKYVCWKCFGDYAIQEFIKNEAKYLSCDYCERTSSREPIAAHINDVIGFILDGIETEWGDPANSMSWESKEGGYIGEVTDIYSLLMEIDLGIDNDELFDDIAKSIMQTEWCQIDPYGLTPQEEWYYDWNEFSDQLKHHVRYVFFNIPQNEMGEHNIKKQPYEVLAKIGEIVNELDLIKNLSKKETTIFRCRNNNADENFTTVDELGPPSAHEAKYANRMSPAGIPMFYGSFDEQTAISETYDEDHEFTTVAAFDTLKSFRVLDLNNLPPIPSLFDQSDNYLRPARIFMHLFLNDLSKPIDKKDRAHIEYVPTQVVTEYFRHIYHDQNGEPINGILYPSSRHSGGVSCVLFIEKENCIQDNIMREFEFPWQKAEAFVSMDSSSIKIKRINPKS
jgi:hypothetical protein